MWFFICSTWSRQNKSTSCTPATARSSNVYSINGVLHSGRRHYHEGTEDWEYAACARQAELRTITYQAKLNRDQRPFPFRSAKRTLGLSRVTGRNRSSKLSASTTA